MDKIPGRAFVPEGGAHEEPAIEDSIGCGVELGPTELA
jgi:hypothetical protein